MPKPEKIIDVKTDEDLEKIEEDIIEAADKAGKRNVIVNVFAGPGERLKRRWQVHYKFNKKHLIMDIMIALGVLFLIGLNIFWWYGGFHYFFNRLDLTARFSSEKIVSGESNEIIIEYNNRNKFEIEEAVLSLSFPQYFVLDGVDRENYDTRNNILVLGDLAPGANGKIIIKGKIFGSLDEQQAIFASVNYFKTDKKGNRLWGQFRKNTILEYIINSSPLILEGNVIANDIIRGQSLSLPVKVKNTSQDNEYKKLELRFISDAEVKLTSDQSIEILDLKPGEERSFSFGYRVNTDKQYKDVKVELHWLDAQGDLIQANWQAHYKITDQKLTFTQQLVRTGPVNPGEWVDFILTYKNAGDTTLHNVILTETFLGDYWDVSEIKKEGGNFYPASPRSLTWTEKDLPKLALIQPGEEGTLKVSVKTKAYVPGSSDLNLQAFTMTHNIINEKDIKIENDPLIIKLNSNLAVQVYPMYYAPTGDQLGRGPLPPKIGETTKYWVFAKLVNDISPVENVVLSMDLPLNVSWGGHSNVPVGDPLVYDPNSRTVSWKLSELPIKPTNVGFAFEVGIIPLASQIGQNPILIQNIHVQGRDKHTGNMIDKNLGNITTKLIQDTKGKLRDNVVR